LLILLGVISLLPACARFPACDPRPHGLVSWWRAEGDAADHAGTNNGSPQDGASFAGGKVGQAFNLNGLSQFIKVPDAPNLTPAGSFSIEGWIKVGDNGRQQAIFMKWGDDQRSYGFAVMPGCALQLAITDVSHYNDRAFHTFNSPPNVFAANTWTHVAAVYDQSTGTRRIYVNGSEVASRTDDPITIYRGTSPVGIGAIAGNINPPASLFQGLLDEVSYYDTTLTQSQIQAIYKAGSAGKCSH
jgi:hypothetical protein